MKRKIYARDILDDSAMQLHDLLIVCKEEVNFFPAVMVANFEKVF